MCLQMVQICYQEQYSRAKWLHTTEASYAQVIKDKKIVMKKNLVTKGKNKAKPKVDNTKGILTLALTFVVIIG